MTETDRLLSDKCWYSIYLNNLKTFVKSTTTFFSFSDGWRVNQIIPYVIKSKLKSDVIVAVAFAIDSDSLKNCLDVGIDAWGWEA